MADVALPAMAYLKKQGGDVEAQPMETGEVVDSALDSNQAAVVVWSRLMVEIPKSLLVHYMLNLLATIHHNSPGRQSLNAGKRSPSKKKERAVGSKSNSAIKETHETGINTAAAQNHPEEEGLRRRQIQTPAEKNRLRRREKDRHCKSIGEKWLTKISKDGNSDSSYIFLCWGSNNLCQGFWVPIPISFDELAAWNKLQDMYWSSRGWLRRYLLFRSVSAVTLVKVTLAELLENHGSGMGSNARSVFAARYEEEDVMAERKDLKDQIERYKETEYSCPYDAKEGITDCHDDCVSYLTDGEVQCPDQRHHSNRKRLRNLDNLPLFITTFNQSGYAGHLGLLGLEGLTRCHMDLFRGFNFANYPLADHSFRALRIEESFTFGSCSIAALIILLMLIIAILSLRLASCDWGTIWSAVGALAGVFALYIHWIK